MNHAQEQRRKQAVVRYLAGDKIEAGYSLKAGHLMTSMT